LEKAFQETGEALEPLSELSEHEDHYLLRVEVPGLGPGTWRCASRGTSWS
jgi:HSP20 family protein